MDFPAGPVEKNPTAMQETQVQCLSQEDPLGKDMATYSSILDWEIPRTEEPGQLPVHGVLKEGTQLNA